MAPVPPRLAEALRDRYRIAREVGRGGMATVYLADDLRHDRQVAIKVLRPELAAALGPERFLQEIALTAKLQHPHILPLFDSGQAGEFLYYVMPFVAGESLRDRLRREKQLPLEDALRIAQEAAGALDFAHRQGVIHRDIKPENILLQDGRALVADFGIALAVREAGGERLTETGLSLGTPQYMSPEQAMAERHLDARTDTYSLGAVLYEMLAGEPPFTGATGQAVIARLMTQRPTPLTTLRDTVPAALNAVIDRAMAKAPADRYPTAAAFAAALGTATGERAAAARRPSVWIWGGVLVVALAAWAMTQHPDRGRRDPEVADLYARAMREYDRRTVAGTVQAIAEFRALLQRDSSNAAAWTGLAKAYVRAYGRNFTLPGVSRDSTVHLAVSAVDRALAADSNAVEAWVAEALVSRILDPTDPGPTLKALRRGLALDSTSGPAWTWYAMTLADAGDLTAAHRAWHAGAVRAPAYAEGMAFLALSEYWRGQSDSAQFWVDSAVAVDPNYALARATAGYVAIELGDFGRGASSFEAARRLSDGIEVVNALAGSALVAARAGRRDEARALLRGVDSMAAGYSPTPLHTAVYVAQAYVGLGESTRAIAWLGRYEPRADLHFQLHLRCDPVFAPIEKDPHFAALLLPGRPRPTGGCRGN